MDNFLDHPPKNRSNTRTPFHLRGDAHELGKPFLH